MTGSRPTGASRYGIDTHTGCGGAQVAQVSQFRITIENTGEIFHCGPETNVLEAMEGALCKGIPVGCRNGGCGACKARVVEGRYVTKK